MMKMEKSRQILQIDAMDLEKLLKSNTTLIREKRAIGAIDKNDNPIKQDKSSDIIDKVISFNKANPNLVASIDRDGGDFVIDVARKTVHNQDIPTDIMFSNSLNNELRAIMRSLGFDVEVKEGLTYEGIFDPLNGKETAEKLRTVIQVAEGDIGEAAFPEEFSHFIIEGLLNEPFVKRVLNTLNDIEVIKEILGEDFDTYNDLYKGDMFMLQKEAAGKLLHKHIIKQESAPKATSLVGRLWNWAKNKFKQIGMSSIDRAIDRANQNIERIATSILDGSIIPLFNKEMLQDSKPLYRVAKKVVTFEDTVQKSLEFYSKRIKILQSRSKRGKYKKSDVQTIKQMQGLIEKKEYAKSIIKFLGESLTEIQKLHKKINSLVDNQGESDTSLTRIGAVSKTLLNIDEFSQAYESILKSLSTVSSLKRDPDITLTDEDAALIEDASSEILKIINTINNTYEELRFNTVWNFLSKYWGEDKIQSLTGDGTDKLTLEMILNTAYKDINGLDRWISSLSDASDPLLSLVDKVVKVSQGKRDRILENPFTRYQIGSCRLN